VPTIRTNASSVDVSPERVARALETVRTNLLAQRVEGGHWVGELSASALSTATAVMALRWMQNSQPATVSSVYQTLIDGGLNWLAAHQNADGGWGDTVKSFSNISTTMLARAVFHRPELDAEYAIVVARAENHIQKAGGVDAVIRRYGKDKTFSVPILTHCALAGLVDWDKITPLPFELACLPPQFYKTVRLPVVSYALPALIAIGQVRFAKRPPGNPLLRGVRRLAVEPTLRRLIQIQPTSGGFLEATPLTSFVTMSLAAAGRVDHPVAKKGAEFIVASVRPDGSWPIDTNLATWVTTLSINALGGDLPDVERQAVREWLLAQQYRVVHPYTNADPGGWAWTDLTGGVPDADDTPGAILALLNLRCGTGWRERPSEERAALAAAVGWLVDLQNGDGGWPTFCRGWGTLPFDRSAADITAHVLRAVSRWLDESAGDGATPQLIKRARAAIRSGFRYLARTQRSDGSWLPLWFGCQYAPDEINPTYGTARVLAAYRDTDQLGCAEAQRGGTWLRAAQNDDGGWGGVRSAPSTVEETALAVEVLLSSDPQDAAALRGLGWLLDRIEEGTYVRPAPIGFYFAKLWYFESLYPQVFVAAALRCADRLMKQTSRSASCPSHRASLGMPTASPQTSR